MGMVLMSMKMGMAWSPASFNDGYDGGVSGDDGGGDSAHEYVDEEDDKVISFI